MAVAGRRRHFLIEYSMHRLCIGMAHIELMDRSLVGAIVSMTAGGHRRTNRDPFSIQSVNICETIADAAGDGDRGLGIGDWGSGTGILLLIAAVDG